MNIPKTEQIKFKESKAAFAIGLDCQNNGRLKVEDVFNDTALPFSAVDRQYCDKIFETIEQIILKQEN